VPGGAIDAGEDPHAAACREVSEELGIEIGVLSVVGEHVFECGGWRYTTVLLAEPDPTALRADGWETDDVRWFDVHHVDELQPLHPAFARSWPALRALVVTGWAEEGRAAATG
jgi:8-oxo-dGTP diphosphatase